jgi:hypothetical protein
MRQFHHPEGAALPAFRNYLDLFLVLSQTHQEQREHLPFLINGNKRRR